MNLFLPRTIHYTIETINPNGNLPMPCSQQISLSFFLARKCPMIPLADNMFQKKVILYVDKFQLSSK